MRYRLGRVGIAFWLLALLAAATVAAPSKPTTPAKPAAPKFARTTVKTLLGEPKKWDGKLVEVEGTVEEYEQRTSKAGHEYSKFRLAMPEVKDRVAVFSFAHLGLANGKKAKVRGLFQETKKVGDVTYRNEIDASKPKGSVEALPSATPPLKRGACRRP